MFYESEGEIWRDEETERKREDTKEGRASWGETLSLMGQVGSSELKQNYQDRGVKGTIYVSGRGRMMILIYYHAPLDESGFSLHARLKETKLPFFRSKHAR